MAEKHRFVFANDDFEVSVHAKGISEERWATLVLAVLDELRRSDARIEFAPLGDEERDRILTEFERPRGHGRKAS